MARNPPEASARKRVHVVLAGSQPNLGESTSQGSQHIIFYIKVKITS